MAADAEPVRDDLSEWIARVADDLPGAEPHMPPGVTDRPAEIWEPLLAVADAAGGHWPDTAHAACSHFVDQAAGHAGSLGIRLLSDLRELFTRRDTDRLATTVILEALNALDEAPWQDLHGKPLDALRLSRMLTRYGVSPAPIRIDGVPTKGYALAGDYGLADPFTRWLPPEPAPPGYSGYEGNSAGQPVTDGAGVTDQSVTPTGSVTP